MRISAAALLTLFPYLAMAGWQFRVISGTCSTGLGDGTEWDESLIHNLDQSACTGCTIHWDGDETAYSGNPCHDCRGRLNYIRNGAYLNFFYENGAHAGVCTPEGFNEVCIGAGWSCSYRVSHTCTFTLEGC
jgi:hypothetical protein